jgi:hypothetical protein
MESAMIAHKSTTLQSGFSFTVPGRLCPNNVYIRKFRNRATKNSRANVDLALIAKLAGDAADQAVWRTIGEGEAVGLTFTLWNQMGDIDARPKILLDGLQTIVYDNDKRVQRLLLEVAFDWEAPRVDVAIEQIPYRQKPPKPHKRTPKLRLMEFEDLGPLEIETIIAGRSAFILDPKPGIVEPITCIDAPAAWRDRIKEDRTKELLCNAT